MKGVALRTMSSHNKNRNSKLFPKPQTLVRMFKTAYEDWVLKGIEYKGFFWIISAYWSSVTSRLMTNTKISLNVKSKKCNFEQYSNYYSLLSNTMIDSLFRIPLSIKHLFNICLWLFNISDHLLFQIYIFFFSGCLRFL